MTNKTAKQLDREIDEALSQGRYLHPGSDRPWWIWQLIGAARVIKKVDLPWGYSLKGLTEGQPFSREHISSLGFKNERKLRVASSRSFGSMLVVEVTGPGIRRMLTPPLYVFADLKKMDPEFNPSGIGSPRFWIQPEIYQATLGEIYQGDDVRELFPVDRNGLQEAQSQHAANDVLVALDAYLTAGKPDKRFV